MSFPILKCAQKWTEVDWKGPKLIGMDQIDRTGMNWTK